ncbi:FAD-dependent oxidoreductase, partial [Myxococcota bacterium]|nr:FAD-dependent oxidoreductase [Myxococcota bacterium]
MLTNYDLVIIGASSAGIAAADSARKTNPKATIALFTDEDTLPYYRPMLTEFLAHP